MLVAVRWGEAAPQGPRDTRVPIALASLENRGARLWISLGVLPVFQLLLLCWRSFVCLDHFSGRSA